MRIHQLLDLCLDYIALDGVLGSDPHLLQQHLISLNPSIDDDFFTFVWRQLCQHPSIQIIVASYPVPRPDGTIITGTAPLPSDYEPPTDEVVDVAQLQKQLVKGRAMAYAIQGDEYRTDKEAIQDRREASQRTHGQNQARSAKERAEKDKLKKKKLKSGTTADVVRFLKEVDNVEEPVLNRSDLPGLLTKWGTRLRVRCVDDEIYSRLTGLPHKISKITPVVFHILQITAKCREKGITAIELGPLVGASQGSMFHYMKTLVNLKLCVKIPSLIHGSVTSLLIYRSFVHQSDAYLNYERQRKALEEIGPITGGVTKDSTTDTSADTAHATSKFGGFPPLTEAEVATGHVVQERLLKLLDHPSLENHLLRMVNLLELIGWRGAYQVRQRRAVLRHVQRLIDKGVVEKVVVGNQNARCLRLCKFNLEGAPAPEARQQLDETDEMEMDDQGSSIEHDTPPDPQDLKPFSYHSNVSLVQMLEYQIFRMICDSKEVGVTIQNIFDHLDQLYKRAIDFQLVRVERQINFPHLGHLAVCSVMESFGRERRVRIYGYESYRSVMVASSHAVDESKMPGDPTAWGHWADISFRKYYNTFKEYDRYIDDMPEPITRKLLGVKPKTPKKAKIVTASQTDVVPGVDDGPDEGEDEEDEEEHGDSEEGRMRRKRKNLFYESTAQIRGRPRKYVAVVDEDGQPNRSIVGKLRHSHNLPHVLIYVRNANRLVDGPAGYTGVGPPPILSPTTIARGNPPEHYAQFRQGADGSPRAQKRKKSTGKLGSGKKGNTRPEEEVATSTVVDPNVGYGPEGEMLVDELLDDADITTALQQLGDPAPLTIGTQSITSFIQQPLSVEDSLTAIQAAQSMPVRTDPDVIMRAEPEVTPVGPAKRQRKRKNPGTPAKGDDSGDVTPKLKRGRKATINSTPAVVQPPTPSEPIALAEAEAAVPIEARVAIPPAEQLLSADAHTAPAQEPAVIPRIDGPSTPASSTVAVPSSSADPLYRTKRARQAIPNVRIRTKGRDRVDLGSLRRANEIVQCLVDAGGVLSEPRHFNEHREWALRVAGTDHPHAPVVAASMDRSVYKRILGTLLRDGRLKETTATIPTVTGRWTRASILYTPETPMSVVQDYIRTLTSVSGYTAPVQTKVAATTYTEFRVSKPTTKEASPTPETQGSAANIVDHRAQLFIQPGVAAGLYGYQSGRNVRLRSWHLAILRALQQGSRSMISSSPRVFASTMFFEDIRVVDFFSNIYLQYHTDELEQYLSDAQNLEVRLADMPDNLKPPSFLGIGIRTKFAGLMTGLHELKLVFPLSATDLPSGDVQITESNGKISNFHIVNTTSLATYYMVADIAPVYHIAVDPPNLLGVMPTSDLEQSETYWDRVKAAALVPDRILLEPVSNMIYEESPSIYFPPIVEIPTEHLKMLRSSMRWRAVPKLLSGQQAALNNAIRQDGTQLVVTDEDMAKLAYDNALPLAFVREQLPLMAARLRARLAMRKTRHAEETEKTTERRRKADESLHRKLAARHAAAKVEWERRVNQACAVVGATMSPELLEYVGRQVLASVNRPNYSDEALQGLVRVFQRGQEVAADRATKPPRPEGLPPLKMVFPRAKRSKKMRVVKETIASRTKGPRRRKQWSNEDDENLLDAEAIIRARSRNLPGNKGRQAVSQIFPDVGLQTFRSRLKKIFETAGKKPYFDRLEDAWYNVWQAHKGTPELPDPDPDSVVNFDLSAHIKFLRQKINKANIRLAAVTNTPMQSQAIAPDLPTDVQHLIEEYDWKYNQVTSLKFSLVHDYHVAEEVRTHQLAQISMLDPDSTIEKVDMNDQPQPFQEAVGPDVRVKGVIRVSLLMIVITATEIYAQSDAAGLLDKYNLHTDINPVIAKLVQDKVLHRTPSAAITKRFYDFTASWRQLIEGPYHPELFNEAALVERSLTQGEGEMPWSLLSTGGELAALMHMVSNDEVSFDFDVETFPTIKYFQTDLNTRKLGDEHFEFDMRIKRTTSKTPTLPSPPKSEELAPEFIPWSADLPPAPQEIFDQLEPVLFDAGPLGLTKSELQTKLHLSNDELDTVLASLTEENSQLRSCFWTGYDTSRLVHISHWDKWAVPLVSRVIKDGKVEIGGVKLYAPRRWVDIYGTFLEGEYKVALRAVLGHILTRPGITEKTLRTRLEIIVDRLETNDLLQRLLDLGQIQRSWMGESAELRKPLPPIQATDVSEEEDIVLRPALGNPLFIN